MKIDIDAIVESKLTLEDTLAMLVIDNKNKGKFFPYATDIGSRTESLFLRKQIVKNSETKSGYDISVEAYAKLRKILGEDAIPKNKVNMTKLDEFWEAYPLTDATGIWKRTRVLRVNKTKCIKLFQEAVKAGYSEDDLIRAVKWEVSDRKERSTRRNEMSFMKASAAWLHQAEYKSILEVISEEGTTKPSGESSWTENVV